jgi:hypothetical protein
VREDADGSVTAYIPAGGGACRGAHLVGAARLPNDLAPEVAAAVTGILQTGGTIVLAQRRYHGQVLGLNHEAWCNVFPGCEVVFRRGPGAMSPEISKWKDGDCIETWDLGSDDKPTMPLTDLKRKLDKGTWDLDDVVHHLEGYLPSYPVPDKRTAWDL